MVCSRASTRVRVRPPPPSPPNIPSHAPLIERKVQKNLCGEAGACEGGVRGERDGCARAGGATPVGRGARAHAPLRAHPPPPACGARQRGSTATFWRGARARVGAQEDARRGGGACAGAGSRGVPGATQRARAPPPGGAAEVSHCGQDSGGGGARARGRRARRRGAHATRKSANGPNLPSSSQVPPSAGGRALDASPRACARHRRPATRATRSRLPTLSCALGSEHTKLIFQSPRKRPRARARARLDVRKANIGR